MDKVLINNRLREVLAIAYKNYIQRVSLQIGKTSKILIESCKLRLRDSLSWYHRKSLLLQSQYSLEYCIEDRACRKLNKFAGLPIGCHQASKYSHHNG